MGGKYIVRFTCVGYPLQSFTCSLERRRVQSFFCKHSPTAATALLPIERASKTYLMNNSDIYKGEWRMVNEVIEVLLIGPGGGAPDKSDPKTPKVSDNRAYMGIIAGYMGIYCHVCIRIVHPPLFAPPQNHSF